MPFERSINNPVGRSEEDPYGIQHNPLDYSKPSYLDPARMSSYGYQYKLAMETGGNSFINVGSGNHLLKYLLTTQNKSVIDFDLDFETLPDIVGVFPHLPFRDKSFDVALCFQTLEHFPFSMFKSSIAELRRVAKTIILGIPDKSRSKREELKYRFYEHAKFPKEWSIYRERSVDKEHFWEIGDGQITVEEITSAVRQTNLIAIKHFRNNLNRYHHFFILRTVEE
ncbi:MAG: class I SAM-dependent methyltransferase [Chloroflexi bacterium]|nr:class I SAM-dependent methyltransferase [Chloroflexota bacterium]